MTRLLFRAGVRWHARHPWQVALALLGVTLGVAVVVAVDVANASARRAFLLSGEAVAGRATHEITGGPGGLTESIYTALRLTLGADMAPVLDRHVRVETAVEPRVLRLLGIDPFAEPPFRPYVAPLTGAGDIGALLSRRAVLLAKATAAALGVAPGDTLQVRAGVRATTVVLAGVLDPADDHAARALHDIIVADIATAQELTGAAGILDRIDLRIAEGAASEPRLAAVRALLPPGARLLDAGVRVGATVRLTRAFETNLTALALVALVFGMFLIYNSVTFSLVQRRPLFALLRTQGVTGGEVLRLVLIEALLLGVIATALGVLLGTMLGSRLLALVSRTINDLYFTVSVTRAELSAWTVVKAAMLGTGATLLAALPPAAEAVRAQPRAALARSTLERPARTRARWLAASGAAVAAVAALLLLLPSRSIVPGFAALFVLILAAALSTPLATLFLAAVARPLFAAAGPVGRLAARAVPASLSRTAPAIAALSVALAVGIAVTIMIGSFRTAVEAWLETSLQADLYISAPGLGADRTEVALHPRLAVEIAGLEGVAGISRYRHASLLLDGDFVRIIAVAFDTAHHRAFELLDGRREDVWRAFQEGGVLISEPIAFRRGLRAGDSLTLPADAGDYDVRVAGVFRDYASEHGVIFIDRGVWSTQWNDIATTSLTVFLAADADADAMLDRIRALPSAAGIVARSNRGLRESTLDVFDRTFLITGVLRLLALIVAFVGVTGALMALQLERSREIGVLRATGLTPAQVWALLTTQSALMGLIAALLALPLGCVMAWAMVHVINRRAFGWTFAMSFEAAPFAQALLVGLAAAVLAAIYPAWRMARTRPAIAVHTE